jgi:hypothetical protein
MKLLKRKLYAIFGIGMILAFSQLYALETHAVELNAGERSLIFLTDVLMVDVAKYNVTLKNDNVNYPEDLGGFPREVVGYLLDSAESRLEAAFEFENGLLTWSNIVALQGSPSYIGPLSENILESADAFLQRYQTNTEDSEVETMRNMLNSVPEIANVTKSEGNMQLTVSSKGSFVSFDWKIVFNGATFTKLGVTFKAGAPYAFMDTRKLYTIGSTSANISEESALNIAKARVANTSWTSDGKTVEGSNITMLGEHSSATLLTTCREPLVLYPYWSVSLTFDKIYPGNVYGVKYSIWADTGEIFYGNLRMLGGSVSSSPNSISSNDPSIQAPRPPSQSPAPEQQPSDTTEEPSVQPTPSTTTPDNQESASTGFRLPIEYGYALAAITVTVTASSVIYFRRRKK